MSTVTAALTVAEELRHAAAVIRERADAATPGPWKHMCLGSEGCQVLKSSYTVRDRGAHRVARFGMKDWHADHADAVHVAGWDPVAAHAVADWLESTARFLDEGAATWGSTQALAVARAYLDEGNDR